MDRADPSTELRAGMLAHLVRQADLRGGDMVTLKAVVEEASELGATRALNRIGLSDGKAGDDIAELRELLGAWRDAKRGAIRATISWVVRGVLALLLIGIAVRLGFGEMVG